MMSKIHENFLGILNGFDAEEKKPNDVYLIKEEFNKVIPQEEGYEATTEEKAEFLAFTLSEKFGENYAGNGSFFGPSLIMIDHAGKQCSRMLFCTSR